MCHCKLSAMIQHMDRLVLPDNAEHLPLRDWYRFLNQTRVHKTTFVMHQRQIHLARPDLNDIQAVARTITKRFGDEYDKRKSYTKLFLPTDIAQNCCALLSARE